MVTISTTRTAVDQPEDRSKGNTCKIAMAADSPIAVVVTAAFAGSHQAGTLLSIYLLAQRAFWGFDGVVDLSLGTQSVRGAVARCFELVDAGRGER